MFRAITGALFEECWRTAIGEPILTSDPLHWEESHWGTVLSVQIGSKKSMDVLLSFRRLTILLLGSHVLLGVLG